MHVHINKYMYKHLCLHRNVPSQREILSSAPVIPLTLCYVHPPPSPLGSSSPPSLTLHCVYSPVLPCLPLCCVSTLHLTPPLSPLPSPHPMLCHRDALSLADDLQGALVELEGEEGVPVVPVELADPNIAKIFSKSARAKVSATTKKTLILSIFCVHPLGMYMYIVHVYCLKNLHLPCIYIQSVY